jgi:hypothetical protein
VVPPLELDEDDDDEDDEEEDDEDDELDDDEDEDADDDADEDDADDDDAEDVDDDDAEAEDEAPPSPLEDACIPLDVCPDDFEELASIEPPVPPLPPSPSSTPRNVEPSAQERITNGGKTSAAAKNRRYSMRSSYEICMDSDREKPSGRYSLPVDLFVLASYANVR